MAEELSKLIEFEWLFFCIKISDSRVYENAKIIKDIKFKDN